ncbi:MAG: hypothetical protein ABIW79_00865 [Gemmatimonas sp.]
MTSPLERLATVYLAEDLKHDRKVALKVHYPELPAVLGAERFIVEIGTTAASGPQSAASCSTGPASHRRRQSSSPRASSPRRLFASDW